MVGGVTLIGGFGNESDGCGEVTLWTAAVPTSRSANHAPTTRMTKTITPNVMERRSELTPPRSTHEHESLSVRRFPPLRRGLRDDDDVDRVLVVALHEHEDADD